ncbi:MAG: 3-dehydroquinate synthase [Gammaproteobacteria bacterium]|jgi:3-dehydroquinate synthase|nr:3-dehydroquinate synthase [Gammaproteobacteria bacterium]MBT3722738.1 3-dehydroquinate synthase [Gammaproteobacteria bacterium]MBT4196148.1 3-dehydroquinate synthase [Gammaproteobacteria bacterium]MBT4448636.1 3-dehydroquinate synthase [Gammaproteobacteria bacterium]MBT4860288.1 3-dehydroquinate synthase [Gammaproteobacteria bacterium]
MKPLHQLNVELGDRSYPIFIGEQLLDNPALLTDYIKGSSVVIVSNTTVAPLYLDKVISSLDTIDTRYDTVILEDGEAYKTLDSVNSIIDTLLKKRHDRNTTLIALGGGVVGDITGFAAAIYQRGIHFIQIPTTLLSQVDSSVGGKTGVNHPAGKNMIGAFYQPQCVIIDTSTLSTLTKRDLSGGFAEVIKYGLIHDEKFFDWLEQNIDELMQLDYQLISQAIHVSCQTKADIVAIDETEQGIRAILNLGHTFGHAIEATMGYGNWLHGEAVATGMVMAADLSERHQWINPEVKLRTINLLKKAGLPVHSPDEMTIEKYMQAMSIDKKVDRGIIKFVLLKQLGEAIVTADYDPKLLEKTLLES